MRSLPPQRFEGMIKERFSEYVGSTVTLHLLGQTIGFHETGQLNFVDDSWVEITKSRGEILLVPVSAIRMLKLTDTFQQDEEITIRHEEISNQQSENIRRFLIF